MIQGHLSLKRVSELGLHIYSMKMVTSIQEFVTEVGRNTIEDIKTRVEINQKIIINGSDDLLLQ